MDTRGSPTNRSERLLGDRSYDSRQWAIGSGSQVGWRDKNNSRLSLRATEKKPSAGPVSRMSVWLVESASGGWTFLAVVAERGAGA